MAHPATSGQRAQGGTGWQRSSSAPDRGCIEAHARLIGWRTRHRGWLRRLRHRRTAHRTTQQMSAHLARLERAGPLHKGPMVRVYSEPADAGRLIVGQRSARTHRCFPYRRNTKGECLTA